MELPLCSAASTAPWGMGLPLMDSVCFSSPQQDPFFPGWYFCSSIQKVKGTSAVLVWALYKQRISEFNKCLLELVKEVINTKAPRASSASNVWHQDSRLFIISTWLSSLSWEGTGLWSEHTYLYLFDFGRFFLTRPGEAGEGAVSKGRHGTDSISDKEQWHEEAVASSFLPWWEVKIRNMKRFAQDWVTSKKETGFCFCLTPSSSCYA